MRLSRIDRTGAVICCLWLAACSTPGVKSASGDPPPNTYRLANFEVAYSDSAPETVPGAAVTSTFFGTAKALPLLGRLFAADEFNASPVVLLSDRLWKRRFGGDPAIIGQKARLNGKEFVVLGVMPAAFEVPPRAELWVPMGDPTN